MCGIVAYLGDKQAVALLLEGLKRLEYRGYDSAGLAVVEQKDGKEAVLRVEKHTGKVHILTDACKGRNFDATLGIAHTRWATHGPPCDKNSHPHTSQDEGLAIVHNGILENYQTLKKHLVEEGYTFKSETDSEVLAHLIRHIQSMEPDMSLEDAVSLSLAQVRGAYGVCVIDQANPDVLIGARRGSPLILGVGKEGLMLASDATALIGMSEKVVYLQDEDMVVCSRTQRENDVVGYTFHVKSMAAEVELVNLGLGLPTSRAPSGSIGSMESVDSSTQGTARRRSVLEKDIRKSMKTQNIQTVFRAMHDLTMSLDKIEKSGYEHFMLKEIMEQPRVLRDCMRGRVNPETGSIVLSGITQELDKLLAARRIIICACGTSWHSALVGEYLIETLAKIPVEVEYASEFRYRNPVLFDDDVIFVISQSGETADTLEAVRIAKKHKCTAMGIVNVVGSSIARETDAGVYLHVGPEIGVASTKAFTGQVLTLTMIAIILAQAKGVFNDEKTKKYVQALHKIPSLIESVLDEANCKRIHEMALTYRYAHNFLYLGRGFNFPVALEGALKLKEISYIHAEGYPAAEMKHGPIALIDEMMPVVIIAPKNDNTYEKVVSGLQEVMARKGSVIVITTEGNDELDKLAEYVIKVPSTLEEFSPLVTSIPLQLLSYYIAKLRGCAIDYPKNLAKSVTVE